jgi:hypothetical protein
VVGRRLLCLTEEGTLVTFCAYSHDPAARFETLSTRFVTRLADAMGAPIAARGSVPTLVASDWYDDGPVDIARQFAFLDEASPFRRSLVEIEGGSLLARIRQEIDQPHLEPFVIPLLLPLPEIDARPGLVTELLPLLDTTRLPPSSCLRVVHLLDKAGAAHLSRYAAHLADHLRDSHRAHGWIDPSALRFIARHTPSATLRLLRETRPRGVRSWRQETSAERLVAAGDALAALHRNKQARDLYERASSARGSKELKRHAAQRAAELSV